MFVQLHRIDQEARLRATSRMELPGLELDCQVERETLLDNIEQMKTSIAETHEDLIEATSRRNAEAAQMQAIEIFLAGSDSRDEMLRLFELHEIVRLCRTR
jgi:hypothetical protein